MSDVSVISRLKAELHDNRWGGSMRALLSAAIVEIERLEFKLLAAKNELTYDYIKRTYSFQPEVGKRVRHTETGNCGVIARENHNMSHYVMVRFDERKYSSPCHPGALEYLPESTPRVSAPSATRDNEQ